MSAEPVSARVMHGSRFAMQEMTFDPTPMVVSFICNGSRNAGDDADCYRCPDLYHSVPGSVSTGLEIFPIVNHSNCRVSYRTRKASGRVSSTRPCGAMGQFISQRMMLPQTTCRISARVNIFSHPDAGQKEKCHREHKDRRFSEMECHPTDYKCKHCTSAVTVCSVPAIGIGRCPECRGR